MANKWRQHVKKTFRQMKSKDKSITLKDAMKEASRTWKG